MSDVPTFTAHQDRCTYRVDMGFTTDALYAPHCHLYQFPPDIPSVCIKAIGHNRFASRQDCADWIEAHLPGVSVDWNVQQCRLPGMWGAPPLQKPWLSAIRLCLHHLET